MLNTKALLLVEPVSSENSDETSIWKYFLSELGPKTRELGLIFTPVALLARASSIVTSSLGG